MAVSELIYPNKLMLAGNPVIAKLQTDDPMIGSDTLASHTLTFVARAAAGETMTISLLNGEYELIFTSANLPDDSGKQFRYLGVTAPDLSYVFEVKTWLEKNYIISTYYDLSASGTNLTITAKEYGEEFNVEFLDADFSYSTSSLVAGAQQSQKQSIAIESILYMEVDSAWQIVLDEGDRITPDNDGISVFDFQELIKAKLDELQENVLNMQYPDTGISDFIKEQDDLIRKFKYTYTEFYGDPYIPEYMIQESSTFYAIPGGYSQEKLSTMNQAGDSFFNRVTNDKMFLSWQPVDIKCHYQQFYRLFFLNIVNTSSIKLMAQLTFSNGLVPSDREIFELTSVNQYSVLEIVLSPQMIMDEVESITPSGYVLSNFKIWLEDNSSNRISEYRTITIDHEDHENVRYFMFLNSYEVFETIYTTGFGIKRHDYEKISVSKQLQHDFTNLEHEIIDDQVFEADIQKVNTGYFDSIDHIERFRDFLISKRVYEIIDGCLFPIKITTNKVVTVNDQEFYYAVEFEYRRGYQSQYYSVNQNTSMAARSATFVDSDDADYSHEFVTR